MITSIEIAPAPELSPFIRCYSYREFNTNGTDLLKPWHASHEISLHFFFKALPVKLTCPNTGVTLSTGSYGGIMGLSTQYNGMMTFNGSYSFFEIIFKADGFTRIFGLPARNFINKIICVDDIFGSGIRIFYEQLYSAKDLNEMSVLSNAYLLPYLKKQEISGKNTAITNASNLINKAFGKINSKQLAGHANMSERNFERHFIEQVGISAKLYSCIVRFNNAFATKLTNPKKGWSSIAYECGYFDQTHLIKDFKKFSGSSPLAFLKQTPLTQEVYLTRTEI